MRVALGMLLGVLVCLPAGAQTWTSRLLTTDHGAYIPAQVNFSGRAWKLDDYSYAGYFLGASSPGTMPCNAINVTATGDITAALQAAVDAAGQAGGGTVILPVGAFIVSSPIAIPYSNVSIEGAGSDRTLLEIPAGYASTGDPYDGVFTFGKQAGASNTGWVDQGPVIATVSKIVQEGDQQIDTVDASHVNPGDWIVVQQYFWAGLVNANSADPDRWPADSSNSAYSFSYLRQVTARSGNRIIVDAPIPWTLDPANNPVRIRLTDGQMKSNDGVKGLAIHFANNQLAATGRPHGTGVYFEGVRNGWVIDVLVRNVARAGIHVRSSARIGILDSTVLGAQDYGDGYGGGFFADASQNVLIKRCRGEDTRRNFSSAHALTSMLVLTQNVSANATEPDGTESTLEQAILWDKHTQQNGGALAMLNRGGVSGGAYETLGSGVVWNFSGDGVQGRLAEGGALYLKPSPSGQLIVVGVNGSVKVYDGSQGNIPPLAAGEQIQGSAALQVGSGPLKNVLYEGLYRTGLEPASLYEAQLAHRVGVPPPEWFEACGET
ncbi:MAG: glycosyl hydrolase family 28-related protein, partial [Bryobacteraceae bacterium]